MSVIQLNTYCAYRVISHDFDAAGSDRQVHVHAAQWEKGSANQHQDTLRDDRASPGHRTAPDARGLALRN